ncbi:MAG: response regulator [Candidatus Omnitrophota bacterium]
MGKENTQRILLIDDDALILRSYEKLLQREGYSVRSASNYQEAMKALAEQAFDLIISDIRMPGKNGVETVAEIQKKLHAIQGRDLPIIFITGYAEFGEQLDAKFLGEVLYKPIENMRLLSAIRDYL